jgi:excinuclease UvrABC ATPase subunit
MSLVTSKIKLKGLIQIGTVANDQDQSRNARRSPQEIKRSTQEIRSQIYYDPSVEKSKRVKSLSLSKAIESIPYLDVAHHQRSASFISGISGSGKSTKAAEIMVNLRQLRKEVQDDLYLHIKLLRCGPSL